MNRPLILAAVLFAIALPVSAEELTMTIVNRSSDTVSGINSFPLGADGSVIDDNIGGLYDAVPPGTEADFTINSRCAPLRFYVRLAGMEAAGEDDLTIDVDTCASRKIVVSD